MAVLFWCCALTALAEDLEFDSPYTHYILRRQGTVVEMHHMRRQVDWLESAVDLGDPLRQVVPYTRMLFGGLFFNQPDRVLMIGLGGGGFHRLFNAAFTNALLQTAEIDSMALKLATAHMGFATTPRNVVTIEDGRRFVRKTRLKWDWVILDAFHGGDVPFHLKTREFYREIGRILATDGVMIANLHGNNELFYCDVKTIVASFAQALFLRAPGRGNVIAIAADYRTPSLREQLRTADRSQWPAVLGRYIDFDEIAASVADVQPQGAVRGRLLTDDFAPAEFYNASKP